MAFKMRTSPLAGFLKKASPLHRNEGKKTFSIEQDDPNYKRSTTGYSKKVGELKKTEKIGLKKTSKLKKTNYGEPFMNAPYRNPLEANSGAREKKVYPHGYKNAPSILNKK